MANTLTAIIPTLQDSANMIGRELVGFIPASYKNTSASRAGFNQTINYPIVPTLTAAAVAPAATPPAGTDIVQGAGSITMNNLRKVSWNWTGEERRALENGDIAPYQNIIAQTIQQAMRTLTNEVENSLWVEAYKNASRAYGTAAQTPFATANDFTEIANISRILDDNGTPKPDRHLIVGSAAMVNLLGKQTLLIRENESGTDQGLRQGVVGRIIGFDVHESYPIASVTAGTQAAGTTDAAGYAIGATTITLASAGTGTIVAGDILAITGDGAAGKYVVKTGDTDVSNGGTFIIGGPGLRGTLTAATHALTTTAAYTPNIAMHRNALHLVMRAPDTGGDAAMDTVEVTDPVSGLVFQLATYGQYMQRSFELRMLYGVKAVKSDFIATLIG
jgi:hypothetical protein